MSYTQLPFPIAYYHKVQPNWPEGGNHIMATYNNEHVVLYQACRDSIAMFVAANQSFRKNYNHLKINWALKPTFFSVIYASGWATKQDMEHILALTITRSGFEELLRCSIKMRDAMRPECEFEWEQEHDPFGEEIERGTISLSLRKKMLERFLDEMIVKIDDITQFVRKQRRCLLGWGGLQQMMVPDELSYNLVDDSLTPDMCLDKFYEMPPEEEEEDWGGVKEEEEEYEDGSEYDEYEEEDEIVIPDDNGCGPDLE